VEAPRAFQALVCAIQGVPFGPGTPIAPRDDVCPYRGLQQFDEAHADFFFGREGDVQRLVEKLKAGRFLAVLGPSGSGKSSVVRAGLVPALRRGALPGSESWTIRVLKPGGRPLTELATHLAELGRGGAMQDTLDRLATDARTLDLGGALALAGQPEGARLVWVVDQFEEVFTLCRDEAERRGLLQNLLYAATVPEGRSVVVLTMRADFYHRCAAYPELASALAAQQLLVSPMDRDDLRQVIVEPARRVGLELEEGLTETILDDVAERPGALPLLEHALLELWERRRGAMLTLEGYRASGGVEGALAQRADAIYGTFSPEQQAIARRALLRLTQPGEGTEDTRRRAALGELVARGGEGSAVEAVLRDLTNARLLTTSRDEQAGEGWVDISHEALIRGWPRLREWLDEDRAALRVHRRLTEAAQEWERLGRDEGLLYRGARLAEAVEWREGHAELLNAQERGFLAASVGLREGERRARERARRRTLGLAVGAALFFLLLAATARLQWWQAEEQRQVAEEQRRVALSRQLSAQSVALPDDRLPLAMLLSVEAHRASDTLEARSSLLSGLASSPHLLTYLRHEAAVWAVTFSPDGKTLASAGDDGSIRLWDATTGQTIGQPLRADDYTFKTVAFSPDGKLLAAGAGDNAVRLWDTASGQPVGRPLTGHTGGIASVAFSPDSRLLASGSLDRTIRLWDPTTGQSVGQPLAGDGGEVWNLAFSPDGKTLASGGVDASIRLWDTATGQAVGNPLGLHPTAALSVAFSPNGKVVASGGGDRTVRLWDAATGEAIGQPLAGHAELVLSLAFSPDGRLLASGSLDKTVRLWDAATGRPVGQPLIGHNDRIRSVAFSPDGTLLASAGGLDATVVLWTVAPGRAISRVLTGHTSGVSGLALSPDGRIVASGSADASIRLWDATTGQAVGQLLVDPNEGSRSEVNDVAFSSDGRTLAAGGQDGSVWLWDTGTGRPRGRPLTGHTAAILTVAFSPDGKSLASAGKDRTIRLWDAASGQPIGQPLAGHSDDVEEVTFSPDSRTLASASDDGGVQVWDVSSGQALGQPLRVDGHVVMTVAFSPDGKTLASGGKDQRVWLWDAATGRTAGAAFSGHTDTVASVAFSPDGKTLASGSWDATIRLWDIATNRAVGKPLVGHAFYAPSLPSLSSLAFSRDGEMLASGGTDTTVRLWPVGAESWRARACGRANRNLRTQEWRQYLGDVPYRKTCPDLPDPES
ncbi:MAG: hypothetical protein H0V51_25440, partial [Chloroflexi bacterium]|nr:hypothetical protein [Chloroflexota bacterium]